MTDSAPIRVLHVDDEPGFAEMAGEFLRRDDDGFTVRTATSTDAGLEALAATEVDCIVSDYDMPERTGIEFLEAVREDHPELPFILFTGKGNEEVASQAITAGVTDYLQKDAGTSQYTILANRIRNAVDRRRALVERRENERRFEAVFEDPQMLVGVLDADGRVEQVNQTAMELIEPTEERVLGTAFWETPWWGEDLQSDVEEWVERAASGEYVSFEADLAQPSGDPYSLSGTIRPVTDEAGEVVSLVASAKDITEQRRRQRELEEEQAFVEQALDTLDEAFYVIGTDGTLKRWNDSLCEVTGYGDDEIGGMHFHEFFDGEDADRVADAVSDVLETGQASLQADILTASGERTPYELTGARLTDSDGDLVGLVGVARDLAERREREQEIERVRDLLEKTEHIADVGGWEIDTETQEVFWTDHLFELLEVEYDEEPPLDQALDVYHEEDRPIVEEAVEDGLANGEAFDVEARFRTPSEDVRWLRIQGVPEVEDGEAVMLRGAVQDVTERKQYEQRLERQNARLDEFARVVSHDLRNPLNVAEGYVELARETCESPHLDAVAEAHERMDDLIADLLTLAREGQNVSDVEPIDLPALVETCWAQVATADATLNVAAELSVQADRSRLRQLLENVIRNAVEHGGDDVTVRVGELSDGFYVEDDGAGIPESDRERVFENGFSTLDGGSGFGLAIVEQIADAHGWDVHVTDSDAGGARLEFTGVDTAPKHDA
ncbi:PAS domain-containing protein [Halobacterium hubeiense]|uniref:PAS domain-containing sensor histidine kinase n=1 Tax=Halobacterium hubeiense TaxID=1407499 RepID=UPI003C788B8A